MIISSLEAEKSVLGSIIVDPKCITKTLVLTPEDFKNMDNRLVFKAMMSLFEKGKIIDVVVLMSALANKFLVSQLRVLLADLAETVPTSAHVDYYVRIVKNASKKQKALTKTQELVQALREGQELEECQHIANKIGEVLLDTKTDREFSAREGIVEFLKRRQEPKTFLKTGFELLDKYTRLDRGDYVVIGGRPSTGKTALTLQIMLNMAKKQRVVYFSLETSSNKLFDRLLANYAGIELEKIKDLKANDKAEWELIAKNTDSFARLNFYTVDAAGWTVAQIKAKAQELAAEVIFIDYLSLIRGKGANTLERVTNISIDLHILAQQTKMLVFVLSQLNREGKNTPDMTNLRESGQIEQDADVVLLLHKEAGYGQSSERSLIIAKNKEGKTGEINFRFDGGKQTFYGEEARY